QLVVRQRVDLIEDHQRLFSEGAQLLHHGVDRFDMLVDAWMTQIDDVNQEISLDHFLERGLERLDQGVWQFPQKTNGVGKQESLTIRQRQAARGGIEGGEECVFGDNVRARQQI